MHTHWAYPSDRKAQPPSRVIPNGLASALIATTLAVLASACSISSPISSQRPSTPLPAEWSQGPWREARPSDTISRGAWWEIFNDPVLNDLEARAGEHNLNLQAAAARVEQAKALSAYADSALSPQVNLAPSANRTRTSANRPALSPSSPPVSTTSNDFIPSANVRWEADLSGRLAHGVEAAQAATAQSVADQENLKLLVSANLASNYFSLRALDADIAWLSRLVQLEQEALTLVRRRIILGQASALDLAPVEAALELTQVQLETLRGQRDPLLSAMAVLCNTHPQDFHLAAGTLPERIPTRFVGVPSDLLERRPDIASAERAVAQASAQIGIANSARYPSLLLGANLGEESSQLNTLLRAPSLIWSLGINLAQIVYDGGRTRSSIQAAQAAHEASVANYRATVLAAISEVENTLKSTRSLSETLKQQDSVVLTEQRQFELLQKRHKDGYGTRYDVVIAEQALVQSQRAQTQLRGQQVLAAVYLVKALGGGWDAPQTTRKE